MAQANVVKLKSPSSKLAALASKIRATHSEIVETSRYTAEQAVDVGKWLSEAKASDDIPRGGWERWVEQEAGVPHQTADHYIKLFRAVSEQRLTLGDIAEAGQLGALRAIRQTNVEYEPVDETDVDVEYEPVVTKPAPNKPTGIVGSLRRELAEAKKEIDALPQPAPDVFGQGLSDAIDTAYHDLIGDNGVDPRDIDKMLTSLVGTNQLHMMADQVDDLIEFLDKLKPRLEDALMKEDGHG